MTNSIKEFRDGIFALRTRRFGTVAELMIEKLYGYTKPHNQFHDLYDEVRKQRIEVKFSTVMKTNDELITRFNVIEQCKKASASPLHQKLMVFEKKCCTCFNFRKIQPELFRCIV